MNAFNLFHIQGHIRKRDLMMSRVGVYISVIIVLCHSIRLVPNFWEFWTRVMVKEVINTLELETNICEDFIITEKSPSRTFSLLLLFASLFLMPSL